MTRPAVYFVTDIETDGPLPAENSMLSFATVAVSASGELLGEFEAVLAPRPGHAPDPGTLAWWRERPEQWRAATEGAEPPENVMPRFADWVEGFDAVRLFAARPLMFDGPWMDAYLAAFGGARAIDGPFPGRKIFHGGGLDIPSYLMGVFGRTEPHLASDPIPPDWLGDLPHTHRAIDDARGYAALLSRLLRMAAEAPRIPDGFPRFLA